MTMARNRRGWVWVSFVFLFWRTVSSAAAEDLDLQFFLAKASTQESELSKKEKEELLTRIEEVLDQIQKVQKRLTETIQAGEVDFRYQEGRFWMSKLEADGRSLETGFQQLKLIKEKTSHLTAPIRLYKSLRDLACNLSTYNSVSPFCAVIGDLSSEVGLWADPVFYDLYLLPMVKGKDLEKPIPPTPAKENKKENKKGNGKKKPPSEASPSQPPDSRKR
jgi:hypothetical protein